MYIEYYVYDDTKHKNEKEGRSGDREIRYKIKGNKIWILEIEDFI